jgi:hypothetical protein
MNKVIYYMFLFRVISFLDEFCDSLASGSKIEVPKIE